MSEQPGANGRDPEGGADPEDIAPTPEGQAEAGREGEASSAPDATPDASAPDAAAAGNPGPTAGNPGPAAADPGPSAADPGPAEEVTLVSQGFLVEFDREDTLMAGAAQVRAAGYSHWDCHTPYPVHGLDKAMGVRATILPWIVLGGGLAGCTTGLVLQLYTNGIVLPFSLSGGFTETFIWPFLPSGYPYIVSGKPVFSVPAYIPVTFELTILLSALGAFFGMWGLNKLPRFWHPVFHSARFRRATDDRFFISIEAEDALYDRERTRRLAESLGGTHVEELLGEEG